MKSAKKDDNKVVIDKKIADMLQRAAAGIDEKELKLLNTAIKWEAVKAKIDDEEWGSGLTDTDEEGGEKDE